MGLGSIPACAGEPRKRRPRWHSDRVYPRVCGGTRGGASDGGTLWGLSPRVRGNRGSATKFAIASGSIPACAGEPGNNSLLLPYIRVYPRVCGGTRLFFPCLSPLSGLSPRVRGNLAYPNALAFYWGSIPACAGEPRHHEGSRRYARVYPRVCGGTVENLGVERTYTGLSPRVRGNLAGSVLVVGGDGSIPACAGEPVSSFCTSLLSWVYPRVCGGTMDVLRYHIPQEGLSPRVRGNPGSVAEISAQHGSIPACAGEPCVRDRRAHADRVYPRVCGGTLLSP